MIRFSESSKFGWKQAVGTINAEINGEMKSYRIRLLSIVAKRSPLSE